jgi:hypothetical protein
MDGSPGLKNWFEERYCDDSQAAVAVPLVTPNSLAAVATS